MLSTSDGADAIIAGVQAGDSWVSESTVYRRVIACDESQRLGCRCDVCVTAGRDYGEYKHAQRTLALHLATGSTVYRNTRITNIMSSPWSKLSTCRVGFDLNETL